MEEFTVIAIVIKTESSDHVELPKKFFCQTLKEESSKKWPFYCQADLRVDPPTLRSFFVIFTALSVLPLPI